MQDKNLQERKESRAEILEEKIKWKLKFLLEPLQPDAIEQFYSILHYRKSVYIERV